MKFLKQFPEFKKELNKAQLDNIKQIDLIWFDKFNNPRYAFEIEESTAIITAFERFVNLLKEDEQIAHNLFIVLPKSRQTTWENKLKTSRYIGEPYISEYQDEFYF